jgi:hypothetical protein
MFKAIIQWILNIFKRKPKKPIPQTTDNSQEIKQFWGKEPDDVDKPVWQVVRISPIGLRVCWKEKYGPDREENCIGLWATSTQYMLTWKDDKKVFIEKSNITELKVDDEQLI